MPAAARSPLTVSDRTVVFDYGQVISKDPSEADRAALAALAGVAEPVFWPAYERHRDELDRGGLDVAEYWRRVAADCGTAWDDVTVRLLWVADFRSWLSIDPDVAAVLGDLVAGGTRLALLSNAGADFGSYLRHGGLADLFEVVVVSGELGVIKPDAEIFRHTARELGVPLEALVFVDNKQANVDGAAAVGITAHLFTGADALRGFLVSLAR